MTDTWEEKPKNRELGVRGLTKDWPLFRGLSPGREGSMAEERKYKKTSWGERRGRP